MRAILRIIYSRRAIIITSFLSVFIVTAIITFTSRPTYRATAKIFAEQKIQSRLFALPPSLAGNVEIFLQTQMEMILSNSVGEMTVKQLGLQHGFSPPNAVAKAVADLQARTIVGSRVGPKESPSENIIGRSHIILVSVDASDPHEAALTANTICEKYQGFFFEVKGAQAKDVFNFLESQRKHAMDEVKEAEDKFSAFEEKLGVDAIELINLNRGQVKPFAEIERLWGQYQLVRARLAGEIGRIEDIESYLINQDDPSLPSKSWDRNNALITIKKNTLAVESKLAELEPRYTSEYQLIPQLKEQLKNLDILLKREKRQDVRGDYVSAHREKQALTKEAETLELVTGDYPQRVETIIKNKAEYNRLKRDLDSKEKIYDDLITQVQESRISMYSELRKVANIYIMDRALPPLYKLKPKTKMNLIFAAMIGIVLGIGLAFLTDYLDHTIKSVEDIELYLNKPLLISLPVLSREKKDGTDSDISMK